MNCNFDNDEMTCRNCGFDAKKVGATEASGRKWIKQCKGRPCIHLFPVVLRLVECPTCNGSVNLKVFACEKHGECTIGKKLDGLACCATCGDYEASQPTTIHTP